MAELAQLHAGEDPTPAVEGTMLTLGQWIYRWNRMSGADRLAKVEHLFRIADAAERCVTQGHDGLLAELAVKEQAGAERNQFADLLSWQIDLHTVRRGHEHLNRAGCQDCQEFAAVSEHPLIVAFREQRMRAVGEALRTGTYVACQAPEDRAAHDALFIVVDDDEPGATS